LFEADGAGGTELAGHGTAGLGGEAEGSVRGFAFGIGEISELDSLDEVAGRGLEKDFFDLVAGDGVEGFERVNGAILGLERLTEGFGEGGDIGKVPGILSVNGCAELLEPETRFMNFLEIVGDVLEEHTCIFS